MIHEKTPAKVIEDITDIHGRRLVPGTLVIIRREYSVNGGSATRLELEDLNGQFLMGSVPPDYVKILNRGPLSAAVKSYRQEVNQ